jgi:hypothetical protein
MITFTTDSIISSGKEGEREKIGIETDKQRFLFFK